jgi:hypothetical protein
MTTDNKIRDWFNRNFKFATSVFLLAAAWYDLKEAMAVHVESHKLIEYRIKQLEDNNKHVAILSKDACAIIPQKPEITTRKRFK